MVQATSILDRRAPYMSCQPPVRWEQCIQPGAILPHMFPVCAQEGLSSVQTLAAIRHPAFGPLLFQRKTSQHAVAKLGVHLALQLTCIHVSALSLTAWSSDIVKLISLAPQLRLRHGYSPLASWPGTHSTYMLMQSGRNSDSLTLVDQPSSP